MKLVKEHIDFKRHIEPKESMGFDPWDNLDDFTPVEVIKDFSLTMAGKIVPQNPRGFFHCNVGEKYFIKALFANQSHIIYKKKDGNGIMITEPIELIKQYLKII